MAEPRPARLRYLTGNRLELLADHLCAGLAASPLPPEKSETIVVPSRGMGVWLHRQIALRLGIAASIEFPFPARFVDQLAEKFGLGRPEPVDPFRPAAQLFELHELFWEIQKGELQSSELKPVSQHLDADHDGRNRFQLARRLSGLYSTYQFARPRQIEAWGHGRWFAEAGPDLGAGEPWQRDLFTQLVARHAPVQPPSHRLLGLLSGLAAGDFDPGLLPARLSVFGAGTLPPMVAEVFVALARHLPVDFYLLAPTRDYMGDLRTRRERELDETDLDLSPAQELVAELGKLGREFFEVMLDLDPDGAAIEEAGFEDPGSGTVLRHLQSALLDGTADPVEFAEDDRSLKLHCCHSPLREMEVLRDEVLAALADGATDSVGDVLLLVPDIRTYAPFARSVFGAVIDNGDRTLRLPLRVADRSGAVEQPYARLVLRWLDLAASRLTLSEVFPVLQEDVVRQHYGFGPEQLDDLRDRLREAGVVWGVDPAWRAERTGTPPFAGVSWREGIDRMLLGCFTGSVDEMVQGVLPAADAAVSDAESIGALATALDELFALLSGLEGPHPMSAWAELLRSGLTQTAVVTDERGATQRSDCIQVLDRLVDDAAGSEAPLGRLAVLDLLGREFAAIDAGGGLVGGAITVAELRPMRSLPARVIAVAGLDAESFPRRDPRDGLDLVGENRRKGDRSPRDDDRQLFLELLLCARERLIISWVGRDQKDDHPRTLSPCAQELVDTLERLGYRDHTVQHSLQPFAVVGCEESTYDHAMGHAARAMHEAGDTTPFVDVELEAALATPVERIDLADLRAFWKSPAAWFCKRSAELALAFDREEAEAEALGLDALQGWKLRDAALHDPSILEDPERLRIHFGLPDNALVAEDLGSLRRQFDEVAANTGFSPADLVREEIVIDGGDFILSGSLRRIPDGPLVELVAGTWKKAHLVDALVAHVVAGCAGWPGPSRAGSVKEPDRVQTWHPFADPRSVLTELVEGYRRGRRAPLRFYPRTSLAFANQDPGAEADPLEVFRSLEVQAAWSAVVDSSEAWASEGESLDEAVALCVRGLGDAELCNEEFVWWARRFVAWIAEIGGKS